MKEIWKDIPGYEGVYQASNLGQVRSLDRLSKDGRKLKGVILKQMTSKKGYKTLSLSRETYQVHQLIAMTFLNHTKCGMKLIINHINEDKSDNTVENLEICTNRENVLHSNKNKYVGVTKTPSGKFSSAIRINGRRKHLGTFNTPEEAALTYQKALAQIKENKK